MLASARGGRERPPYTLREATANLAKRVPPQGPSGGVKTPPYTPFIHRLFGDERKRRDKVCASLIHRLFGDEKQRNGLAQRSVRCRRCALRRRLAL